MSAEIRVVLADDHPLFRRGLVEMLAEEPDLVLAGEASDGVEALSLIESIRPDAAVLDIDMPRMNGVEVVKEMRSRGISTAVVFLTVHEEREYFEHALSLNVRGYVLKDSAPEEIAAALRQVSQGGAYVSPRLSAHLMPRRPGSPPARDEDDATPVDRLSPAERRVLRLVAEYLTSREIAERLHISLRTVETHRANIAAKVGLRGSHALMKFALENRSRLD